MDDTPALTNKVKFIYATDFKLLGVKIGNKLKQLSKNFEERKKKIRIKIAIWRKLGYLLSMMECPADLTNTI
jgi:hypothetical protein